MPCYHPWKLWQPGASGPVVVQCGRCIGCRLRRRKDWQLRILHEASFNDRNCFVTLTYGTGLLPPAGSLRHRDFQLFMKRLRRAYPDQRIGYYMCGEYGPRGGRAHYHACLFGIDFRDRVEGGRSASGMVFYRSAELSRLWGLGNVSVQDLVPSTAAYCAGYCVDKLTGELGKRAYEWIDPETGVVHDRVPPYGRMSLNPAVGKRWFGKFRSDLFPHDYCVSEGRKELVPRYYDRLEKRADELGFEQIRAARSERGAQRCADSTPARLAVREEVARARVRNQRREAQ